MIKPIFLISLALNSTEPSPYAALINKLIANLKAIQG
jgi:hypothetical protein